MNIENKNLFRLLDLKKLKMVNRPIEKAHGLPNECYVDKNYFTIERKKFLRTNGLLLVLVAQYQKLVTLNHLIS